MTGLKWVRLDTTFPTNQKTLDLAAAGRWRAITVYLCSLAHAGAQGTDGWIPTSALRVIHARPIDAQHLTDAGLWAKEEGGYLIHDWADYQPTSQDINARTIRARDAARARWNRNLPDA